MASNLPNFRILAYFSIHHIYVLVRPDAAVMHGSRMVYSVAHRNNFVGGTCAPPSTILVYACVNFLHLVSAYGNEYFTETSNRLIAILLAIPIRIIYVFNV